MNNQIKLEETLCECPVCKSGEDVVEQSIEIDNEVLNSDIEFPNISTYWFLFTCLNCNISWGYPSWTGE